MIIKVLYSKTVNKIYFSSKPSHSGRDKQYAISYEEKPTIEMLKKMQGKDKAYFHAHMKDDSLVLGDKIDDQQW
jgi:hypothetical protein